MYFENLIQKIKLPFRKDKELYLCLYHILGFYPNNISYYKQALMHKSVSVKGKDGRYLNNERLEFLGDAILDAVVGDVVYRHFENKREGFLTNARSKLVQRETLGKLAVEIGLDKLIQFNQQHTNSHNSYMAGNAFEALVGAIYLDYGYDRCMKFMEKRILNHVIDVDKTAYKEVNFKSKLLEWSQKNRIRLDFKDLHQGVDKDGAHVFNTLVVIEGLDCGRGKGYSKKESQQRAAQETLIMLKKQKGFEESVFEAKSRRTAMEEQPEALLPEIPDEVLTAELKSDAPQKSNRSEQSSNKKEQQGAAKKEQQPAGKKEQQPAAKKEQQPAGKKEQQPAGKKEQQNSVSEPANEQVASDFSFDSVNVGLKKSTLPVEQTSEADSPSAPKAKKQVNSDKKSDKPADKKSDNPADKKSEKPVGKKSEKPAADKKSEKPVVDKTDEQSVATDKAEETDKKEQKAKPARKPRAKKTVPQSEDNTAQQAEPANAEVPSDVEKAVDAEKPVGAETKSNAENAGAEPSADAEKTEKKPSSRRRRKPAAEKAVEKASEDEATGEAEKSAKAEVVEKPAKPIDANSVKKPAKPVETDLAKAEVVKKPAKQVKSEVVDTPVEPSATEAAPASDAATDAEAPAKPKRRGSRRRSSSLGSATHTSN